MEDSKPTIIIIIISNNSSSMLRDAVAMAVVCRQLPPSPLQHSRMTTTKTTPIAPIRRRPPTSPNSSTSTKTSRLIIIIDHTTTNTTTTTDHVITKVALVLESSRQEITHKKRPTTQCRLARLIATFNIRRLAATKATAQLLSTNLSMTMRTFNSMMPPISDMTCPIQQLPPAISKIETTEKRQLLPQT
jgi:hypothetical protein